MRYLFRRLYGWLMMTMVVCVFFSIPAHAQYRAGLQGTVTDPQGRAVPGAKVTLTNKDTNAVRTTATAGNGVYTFDGLGPGHYSLNVSKEGFKTQTYGNVQVSGEEMNSFNAQLAIGQTSQSVTVSAAAAPLINTANASITGTITNHDIQALPSFGRDPMQLLRLSPGTFGNGALSSGGGSQNLPGNAGPGGSSATSSIFQTENQVQMVAGGTRNISNNFQIDGIGVNSLAWGGASVITPNEASVKEVKVVSNNYNAEYGGSSGAQVQIVSQNGTNQFHGSAFFKADRPGLNAYQKWNGPNNAPTQRDSNRFNQFGGSLGGPIVHNKLFFFFSWETLRNDSTDFGQGWYETPQLLKEAPSNTIASKLLSFPGEGASFDSVVQKTCADAGISNPALCLPVSTNGQYLGLDVGSPLTSSAGTSDPTYQSPGNYGVGNGLDGIPDVMFVETTNPTTNIDNQYNTRVDFQLNARNLFSFSTYIVPVESTFYNGPARPANLWHHQGFNHAEGAVWQHIFSPTMLNEARFGIHGWHWNEVNTNPQEPWGLPIDQIDGFGGVTLNSYGAPGPSVFDQKTINFRDTLNKVIGSHSFTFGGGFSLERDLDSITYAARPTYSFRNLWDFVNDAPYQEAGNFNPATGQPTAVTKHIHSDYMAFFGQDSYKMRPNLTLTYGLRWEYFGPISEANGKISNPGLGAMPDPLTKLALKLGGNVYNSSKNNWGPQIGFAWSPNPLLGRSLNNKFVLRGGFGVSYNAEEQAISLNGRFNPPFSTQLSLLGPNIYYAVPSDVHQFSNWPSNPSAVQSFSPSTNLPTSGAPVTLNAVPQNLPTPVTYHYSLQTEYNLGHNWAAMVGYQGSQTRHYTRQNNLNWMYSPLNPMIQGLFYFSNDANASYNALLTQIKHRFSKTFDIDFQYTYSKVLDEGSNDYYIDEYPFNVAYSRGPADFNATHAFKLWGVWSPRIFTNPGLMKTALGGWEISGILTANTGFPFTPVYTNTGCNLIYQSSGYCNLRPAGYSGSAGTNYSNSTFMQPNGNFPNGALSYFTVPAFTQGPAFPAIGPIPPPPGVGRNTFTGPGYFDTDMSLQKTFALPHTRLLGENAAFNIRADFYNIFNKLNLNPFAPYSTSTVISFDGVTSNPQFDQAQSALAGRIISLQARFSF